MVCTLGHGRMAALSRLFILGDSPELTAEEANHDKTAVQMMHRELYDANEANLLDEEDMHIFDCRPLTDPLHLVRCNACQKPVKASQYVAHSERCISINSSEDNTVEFHSSLKPKKPLRKGRDKQQAVNSNQKTESLDRNDNAGTELKLDKQSGMFSSPSGESKYAPAPLATKIYHLQRNHHLRLALGHLYYEESLKENSNNSPSLDLSKDMVSLPSQVLPPNIPQNKEWKGSYSLPSVHKIDQTIPQNSELFLKTSGVSTSTALSSQHSWENTISRSGLPVDAATVGLMRTSYSSPLYSFSGKSGGGNFVFGCALSCFGVFAYICYQS